MTSNKVFIATSLDGFIAESDGKVGFLDTFPMPGNTDMGYHEFISGIDALVMGRKSFETVLEFGVPWPYSKPVFVWSKTLTQIPEELTGKAMLIRGDVQAILHDIHQKGYNRLYIDGGKTIRSFLDHNLINEMTITTIPVLLGQGIPLFGGTKQFLKFRCTASIVYDNGLVQQQFVAY